MSTLACLIALTVAQDPEVSQVAAAVTLKSQVDPRSSFEVHHQIMPMPSAKISPKGEWTFPYLSLAFCQPSGLPSPSIRFRVFSQTRVRQDQDDLAQWVARMMGRLWNYAYFRCDLDHSPRTDRMIDVYLAKEGEAGAEQMFGYDSWELDEQDRPTRKNMIYVYQADRVKRGIQLSRELAHEYGHAVLPIVGGYTAPESYANGDVGERIFLGWFRDDMRAGRVGLEDTVFTDQKALDTYYEAKVKPYVVEFAKNGPNPELLRQRDERAYWHYVAFSTYLARICPMKMYGRFVNLNTKLAEDCLKAIESAAEEQLTWTVTIPAELEGKALMVPLVKGTVSNAKVLSRSGIWAKIQPVRGKVVTITNPPLKS